MLTASSLEPTGIWTSCPHPYLDGLAEAPPPPPTPEELELEREMEYFVEPEEAFTRDEIE